MGRLWSNTNGTGLNVYLEAMKEGGNITLSVPNNISTSGTQSAVLINQTSTGYAFAPTSGTASYSSLRITTNINQTGTANGAIYGVYYNPTLTSVLGTHYGTYINSGLNYFNGGVGIGVLPSTTYKMDIDAGSNGSVRMSFLNGGVNVIKGTSSTSQTVQTWQRTVSGTDYGRINLQYHNANAKYSSLGTLTGYSFGTLEHVTTGDIALTPGASSGSAFYFDIQPTTANPYALSLAVYNSGVLSFPMQWKKDGTTIANTKFGFGTATPTAYVQIKAGTSIANTAPLKFTSGALLTTTEGGAVEYDGAHLYFTATNGGTRYQLDQQSGGGGGTNYWLLSGTNVSLANPSNNVGIGTSDPGPYKLAVEGTLGARKIKVTQASPWADYVFEDGYKLLTLEEVERYIRQNKHLPEVPSAREVEKVGLDVGDNQSTLLKKIEELTLYLIDLNRKVEQLSKENEQLRNELKPPNK
jgi:hypothetical protein